MLFEPCWETNASLKKRARLRVPQSGESSYLGIMPLQGDGSFGSSMPTDLSVIVPGLRVGPMQGEQFKYERLPPSFARARRPLARGLKNLERAIKLKRKAVSTLWQRAYRAENLRLRRAAKNQTKYVVYEFAQIDVDLSDVEMKSADVHLPPYDWLLGGPKAIQNYLRVSRYSFDRNFRRAGRGWEGSRVPADATSITDPSGVIGWYRILTRRRRLTAKELKKPRVVKRYAVQFVRQGMRAWLKTHPFPTDEKIPELKQMLERAEALRLKLRRLCHFQQAYGFRASELPLGELPTWTVFPSQINHATFGYMRWSNWMSFQYEMSRDKVPGAAFMALSGIIADYVTGRWFRQDRTMFNHIRLPPLQEGDRYPDFVGLPGAVDVKSSVTGAEMRTLASPQHVSIASQNPLLADQAVRSRALDLRVMDLDRTMTDDGLDRIVAEFKDVPESAKQAEEFLGWCLGRQHNFPDVPTNCATKFGFSNKVKMAAIPLKGCAAVYLFWKFGVEPTFQDVNRLLSNLNSTVATWRRALNRIYSRIGLAREPATFKLKVPETRDQSVDGRAERYSVLAQYPVFARPFVGAAFDEWLRELPPLKVDEDTRVYYYENKRRFRTLDHCEYSGNLPDGISLIEWLWKPEERSRSVDTNTETAFACLQTMYDAIALSENAPLLFGDLVYNPLAAGSRVFARFAATDIRDAQFEGWYSTLRGNAGALKLAWELLPLSFVADWFLSTQQTMRNVQLLFDSLFVRVPDDGQGLWLTQHSKVYGRLAWAALMTDGTERWHLYSGWPGSIVGDGPDLNDKIYGELIPGDPCRQAVANAFRKCLPNGDKPPADWDRDPSSELTLQLSRIATLQVELPVAGETMTTYSREFLSMWRRGRLSDTWVEALVPLVKVRLTAGKILSLVALLAGRLPSK